MYSVLNGLWLTVVVSQMSAAADTAKRRSL